MLAWESLAERSDNLLGEEIEDQTEGDVDPEDSQEHHSETETNQDCHKAGQGRLPASITASLSN